MEPPSFLPLGTNCREIRAVVKTVYFHLPTKSLNRAHKPIGLRINKCDDSPCRNLGYLSTAEHECAFGPEHCV